MARRRVGGRLRNALGEAHCGWPCDALRRWDAKRRTQKRFFHLEPLEPRCLLARDTAPLGFLIDRPLDESGSIDAAGQIDAYPIEAAGGQTATVIVRAAGGLAPSIELLAPDASSLGSASAPANEVALLQTIGLDASGTYVLAIRGGQTTGDYQVEVIVNAAAEEAPLFHLANDSRDTAQDLDPSFIELPRGIHRGAVRGQLKEGLRPDAFGYAAVTGPFRFEDIGRTGRVLLTSEDDAAAHLTAAQLGGFEFDFYGRTYDSLFVSSNGLITFGSGEGSFDNGDLMQTPAPPTIAVLWDDMDLGFEPEGGQILWELRGKGADRRLVIQWNEIEYYPFDSTGAKRNTISFQAVLSEASGAIELNYLDLAEADDTHTEGASATVGIKDAGMQGGRRLVVAHDGPPSGLVGSQRSIRISLESGDDIVETKDVHKFTALAGQSVTLALGATHDDVLLELVDESATVLARGKTADNLAQAINDFVVSGDAGEEQTLFAYVTPTSQTPKGIDYSLLVLKDAVFDTESNRSFARSQPGRRALGGISPHAFGEAFVLADFLAIDSTGTDCLCEPPDTHAAVGPGHVVAVVNTAIAMFHKDGKLAAPPQELTDFFAPSVVAGEEFEFDPVLAYDDVAGRWIVAALIGATSSATETDLLYAISNTSDPTDGFREQHRIDLSDSNRGLSAEFPKLGFNADAHVFTLNMFAERFEEVKVLAIDKSTVLDGDPRTLSHFTSARREGSFALTAASMHRSKAGDPMWFVEEAVPGGGKSIGVSRMENVLSHSPTYTDFDIAVTSYDATPSAVQPGGLFSTSDSRITSADYRADCLVAAHTVGHDGEATVRWYEFDVRSGNPTLAQEGRIDPGRGAHAFFPSIAMNAAGDVGITYMQSSATEFVSMYVTGQAAGASNGATADGVLVKAGDKTYRGAHGGASSAVGVDPETDTFWAANEVILEGVADPLWSTWIGEFAVSDVQDADWYEAPIAAGDELRITTATPFDGTSAGAKALDPTIALYAPDGRQIAFGDNGDPDGRNALIALTAKESGVYRVRVQGRDGTSGAYILDVQGATAAAAPPQIRDSSPDDGATLGTFPDFMQVTFSESILSTSIDADDLVVDGLPALAVEQVDGGTFRFQLNRPAAQTDQTYAVSIDAGAVVDLQGAPSAGYEATFHLDQTGPRVRRTRWNGDPLPTDHRLAAGPLVFEAYFDEPLFVLGSARRGTTRPGADDAFVANRTTGETIRPRRVWVDVQRNRFAAEFDPLPEGDYTLTLVSGDMAFEDAVGNPLDGEPAGETPDGALTGDGMPGGDYLVDFVMDRDTLLVDEMDPARPLGGLVYLAHQTGVLSPLGDRDSFLVEVDAGQLLSAIATPTNPAAILTLAQGGRDPIVAAAPGAEVFLPAHALAMSGAMALTLSSNVPTEFNLDIFTNTLVERPSNDSTTSQPLAIDASRIEIASGPGGRLATIAASSPETSQNILMRQDFELGPGEFTMDNAFGAGGGLWRLSDGRRADGDPNHSPTQSLYFGQNATSTEGGDYATGAAAEGAAFSPEIELPPTAQVTLSFNHFLETEGIASFDIAEVAVVTQTSEHVVLTSADGTLPAHTNGAWQRAMVDLSPFAGERVRLRFRFDSIDEWANAFEGWFVDDVAIVATVVRAPDLDEFTFSVSGLAGSTIDIALAGLGTADFSSATLEIVSEDGSDVLGTATSAPLGAPARNYDLGIAGFVIPADGFLRIRVRSEVIGNYSLVVTEALALETEPNDFDLGPGGLRTLGGRGGASRVIGFLSVEHVDPADNYRLNLKAGDLATLSIQRPLEVGALPREGDLVVRLEVYDPSGAIVAMARGAPGARDAVVSLVAHSGGAHTIRVVPESGSGEYVLEVSDQPIPGDFDADTDVDGDDLLKLLLHFGIDSGAQPADGDADQDSDVDRVDLSIWRQNAGNGAIQLAPPSNAKPPYAVPIVPSVEAVRASESPGNAPETWAVLLDRAFAEYDDLADLTAERWRARRML